MKAGFGAPSLNLSFPIFQLLIFKRAYNDYKVKASSPSQKQFFIVLFDTVIFVYQLMGNSNDSPAEIDQYNHPRLGNIRRVQQQHSTSQFIDHEIIMENHKIYEQWEKELRLIKNQESAQEILFLPIEHSFKQTAYCGTGGLASLRYQDYLYSLLPEIINRREIKRPFNQQELLYLFYSLVKAASILERLGRIIGDVKPQNILVNEDGYVKIICQVSWPGQPVKYARGWDKNHERILLSPQECQERMKKKQAMMYNPQDNCAEVFSIGLTILEAGSLRDCTEVYGETYEYKFNELKVREFLDIFESRYSKELSEMVREMLHPNPRKRWKADQAYKLLKPYEYQILNLQEIAIKFQSSTYIPKIEREEKISIKRIGDSHLSHSGNNFQARSNARQNDSQVVSSKVSNVEEMSPPLRLSLLPQQQQQQQIIVPPYQSSIHYVRQSNYMPQMPPINGSAYHPEAFPNYQLVNQYTNFGRSLAPQPQPQQLTYNPNQYMANSLPLKLSQHGQQPQEYITQNSMIAQVGRNLDTSYQLGNPRGQMY